MRIYAHRENSKWMAVSTLIVICTNHITGGDMKVSITDPEEKREERKYSPLSGSLGAAQGQYASVRLTIVAEREDIPQCGQMARNALGMFTPRRKRSARRS